MLLPSGCFGKTRLRLRLGLVVVVIRPLICNCFAPLFF